MPSILRTRIVRRVMGPPLVVLAALLFLFEDVLWAFLKALLAQLAKLPVIARFEGWVAGLPPYATMALLLAPGVVIMPAKFVGLWLLGTGHVITGIAVFVAAKIVGMGILVRLFAISREKLLSIGWFCWLHDKVLAAKAWVYVRVNALPGWRQARAVVVAAVAALRRATAPLRAAGARRRRFAAARRAVARRARLSEGPAAS